MQSLVRNQKHLWQVILATIQTVLYPQEKMARNVSRKKKVSNYKK